VIALIFCESGDAGRAARWLGGAEAIRNDLGAAPYPVPSYDETVAAVRRRLGEALDSIWQLGRDTPRDRLVMEVLHEGRVVDAQPEPAKPRSPSTAASLRLTPRQREILTLAATGSSNREIADQLGISARTVERHLTAIFTELGVERRSSAIVLAIDAGLLSTGRN
jgi:DNA-binding NarL/FixJ family response regulator